MAEELTMVKDATPKKAAFMSKPYSNDDKIKKSEEELKKLLEEQKSEKSNTDDSTKQVANNAEPDNAMVIYVSISNSKNRILNQKLRSFKISWKKLLRKIFNFLKQKKK